eukprot:TRINITY_DN24741_c0_g1_i1.p1 TRINITY_DN24741_c0_g1~~TRINITY_DN24741_c0_g1_i1.p1  ORF type:complete len:343 (-),score=100.42 TRINITY_DN24741_c0_g1_i1:10-1038(-)
MALYAPSLQPAFVHLGTSGCSPSGNSAVPHAPSARSPAARIPGEKLHGSADVPPAATIAAASIASMCAGVLAASRGPRGARKARVGTLQRRSGNGEQALQQRRGAVLGLVGGACGIYGGQPVTPAAAMDIKEDEIVQVIDGDTVKLKILGRARLIGVDTPETVSPKQRMEGKPADCFGPEASKFTKDLLPPGTKVKIETDAEPTDRYGRLLVYVYKASDNQFVNAELVKRGLARHLEVKPNTRYAAKFLALEQEAQKAKTGLWGSCSAFGVPEKNAAADFVSSLREKSTPNPGDSKNCSDFQYYEDAKAWFDIYFPLYGDVAKLDGDGDGKPCERLKRKPAA